MSDLYKFAHSLQRTNYYARKMYALAALACFLMGLLSWWLNGNVAPWVLIPLFLGLLIVNERLIRRMRKAGIK